MSNEFEAYGGQDASVYVILKGSGSNRGKVWNGTSFVTYSTADLSTYAISLTELGTSSGQYQGDFPTTITQGGSYPWVAYQQAGGSPAEGDSVIGTGVEDWTGSASASSSATGAMSGSDWLTHVKRTFKRTDKDTEILEATTDAVQIMRRDFDFDEAQTETNTTDTITVAEDYRLNLESDLGLLIGVTVLDTDWAFSLEPVSKKRWDSLFADAPLDVYTGVPKYYCVFGGQILIGPIPDKTTYTFRMSYSARAGTITTSTTGVPFTNLYRDVLRNCTLWILNTTLENWQSAASFKTLYDEGMEKAITRERKNRGSSTFIQEPFSL